jgi:carbamoyltransferase
MLKMAFDLHRSTGKRNLAMAGGVALNCVANGKILREGPFDSIWIQPAAGDAGGALGGAYFTWHQLLDKPRSANPRDSQRGSFYGPSFSAAEVESWLRTHGVVYSTLPDDRLYEHVAAMLAQGSIVGWFQGRMEFGPRALGARSILGDPRSPAMQAKMNLKIKFRESFRPFAPCVLAEHASSWFELEPNQESPYMLLVAPVRDSRRIPVSAALQTIMNSDPDLRKRVNIVRSEIPAVTHVDYSARLQTVDAMRNPRMHRLITEFYRQTGCPVVVNTSFNVRGEPIVCTPEDAYRCFLATEMDALVLENCVLLKQEMKDSTSLPEREQYLAQFQLD